MQSYSLCRSVRAHEFTKYQHVEADSIEERAFRSKGTPVHREKRYQEGNPNCFKVTLLKRIELIQIRRIERQRRPTSS